MRAMINLMLLIEKKLDSFYYQTVVIFAHFDFTFVASISHVIFRTLVLLQQALKS